MGDIKFKVTKIRQETFFLKIGAVVIVNYDEGRVYSEDKKEYMDLDLALKLGLNGKQI